MVRGTVSPAALSGMLRLFYSHGKRLPLGTTAASAGFAVALAAMCVGPVSAQDIIGHVIAGYQGWFSNPNDGSPVGALGTGGNDHSNLETYPDMTDYPASEQFPTSFGNLPDGKPVMMFSSDRTFTANLHAGWMKANGIDVAAIQRFGEVWPDSGNSYNSQKDQIETKMADALAPLGLKFYVEYDASGSAAGGWGSNFVADVEADWQSNQDLDNNLPIWQRSDYAHENGKPVVELWGLGGNFNNIDQSTTDWTNLINWFHSQGVYVIAGVPTGWDGGGWSDALSGFTNVYLLCDAISPWVVGRFSGTSGADSYASGTESPNFTYCKNNNLTFIPCVYPGTSFFNSNGGTKNLIPRIAGGLMWEQFANIRNLGIGTCFVSMFDEFNEATNICNSAANASQISTSHWFLTLDADGTSLSPDYYLRLTNDGGAMMKGKTALTFTPPTAHWTDEPFMGTAWPVPGTVQAENYDTGGQGLAYNITSTNGSANSYRTDGVDLETTSDTGGGFDMGWTAAGQWFNYTVNVQTAGQYTLGFRVASASGGSLHVQNSSGTNLTGSVSVPATGGSQTWTTVNATATLPAGTQVLSVRQDTGGYNVNYIAFTLVSTTPPSTPTGLTATGGNALVSLTWNASGGATSYNIYRATTPGGEGTNAVATSNSSSYTDTGLTNSTTYYYKVAAVNNAGSSSQSAEANATPTAPIAPQVPTGLTASGGLGSVALAWTGVTGTPPITYNIYRGTGPGGEGTTPVVTGLSSTSYNDSGLANGTTYYYKVAAVNVVGTTAQSAEASAKTFTAFDQIDTGSPSAVSPFVADTDFNTGNEFSSTAGINTSGVTNPAPAAVYQTVRWNSSFTYTIPGLTAGQSYTVRLHFCELSFTAAGSRLFNVAINGSSVLSNFDIFATAGAQNKAVIEPFSATANSSGQIVIAFTQGTKDNPEIAGIEVYGAATGGSCSASPAAPTGLASSGVTSTSTNLSWSAVTPPPNCSVSSYTVFKNGASVGTAGSTSFTVTGLSPSTTYTFMVAATDSFGLGSQSAGINVTTLAASCAASLSAPTGLAASNTTSTSTTISWSAVTPPANCSVSGYSVFQNGTSIGTSTTTSFNVTGLSPSTTYTFTVAATDSFGTGAQSSGLNVTTSAASCSASPGAPTGLSSSNTTSTGTTISWSAVTPPASCSVSSYTVFKNGTSIGMSTTTSFNVTGLSASTTYTFTVAATDSFGTGSQSSGLNVTTSGSGGGSNVISIACGNTAQGVFVADTDFSGGAASSGTTSSINTTNVTNPAPVSVYQHGRKGTCTYTIGSLQAGTSYNVRLDFCEYAVTGSGQRTFNVSINGTQVLTNYDIFANAGGEFIANAQSFTAIANSSGQIVIVFTTVLNNALVAGIEVSTTGGGGGLTAVAQIDAGSPSAVSPFSADTDFNTGNEFSSTATINTSGASNPAPAAVYQTVRWNSAFTYTIPSLTPNASYTVRLHFCELTFTGAAERQFNVAINGTSVLSNFDIFATAGAQNKAVTQQFTTTANSSGQVVIAFTQGAHDNPEVAGIEILH